VIRRATATGLALAMVAVLGGCGLTGGGDTYTLVAYFPRAVSVFESSDVRVLGLPAGEVTTVEVDGDRVRVELAIPTDIQVPDGATAQIVPQSLIGARYIQLSPAYQDGMDVLEDGDEVENTVIPVEPDEALAALKEFLDSLDPEGVGRLIDNAATTLEGQGENLGSALDELSELVGNIEDNDDAIISIADRFDDFTSTLLTRESQLAQALDDFAVVAEVLADERADIERLIRGMADLSGSGLDLVSQHAVRLRTDIDIVTRLASSIDTNLAGVQDLLEAGPNIFDGFIGAYNPELRALDLRNSFSPLVAEALQPVFDAVGLPLPCLPVDVVCPGGGAVAGLDAEQPAVRATVERPTTPVDDILGALGSPTATEAPALRSSSAEDDDRGGIWGRFVGTFLGVDR
jgi:phospholipid/cholesterol/gamma-HCH transport system substrate-binding protein